jgi:hypothetical protein
MFVRQRTFSLGQLWEGYKPVAYELPPEITQGATLRGNEYGWTISSFPDALAKAPALGFACLDGQFQFRLDDGTICEMYWLDANPADRAEGQPWQDYCRSSCKEVLQEFQKMLSETDFAKEALNWKFSIDPVKTLVFVAYFVSETDWSRLSVR